jgi:flagellar hook-length control protein FliK
MTPTMATLPVSPSATGQPAAPSTTAANSAAPGDFLLLLAQAAAESVPQAMGSALSSARLGLKDQETTLEEGTLSDSLGALPISLPIMPAEIVLTSSAQKGGSADALMSSVKISAASVSSQSQVELLTEMIQSEQASSRDASDMSESFQLYSTAMDSAHGSKAVSPQDALFRPIHTPVGNAQWADEIGSRLTMMAEQGKQAASLRLSPEHLGPLEIRIAIQDDRASVWFGAAHADTRAAIEHALPRLRELFEAQGMSLADAGVYKEAPREQPNSWRHGAADELDPVDGDQRLSSPVRINVGLVDAYA